MLWAWNVIFVCNTESIFLCVSTSEAEPPPLLHITTLTTEEGHPAITTFQQISPKLLSQKTANNTRSSAIAGGPRDASCQLKSCQLPRNSAETTCTTSPGQIEVMKLEDYSGPMCNKHVHSTMTRSRRFYGCHQQPTTDWVVDITCIPTTCCGEIF